MSAPCVAPVGFSDDAWLLDNDPEARTHSATPAASAPVVDAGYVSAAQHVSVFAERILSELRLREEYGNDAAGGESMGFIEIDDQMIVEGGQLIVIGSREGVGKTSWGLQVARLIATRTSALTGCGGKVVYYITEMGVQETVERVVATLGQLDARKLKRDVTLETIAAVERGFAVLRQSGMYIVNAAGWNNEAIDRDARAFARDNDDLRAVFVDNLTGVSPTKVRRSEGSHEYIGEIVECLNTLSMKDKGIGVPVFLFAHLKRPDRMARSSRPTAADFSGSDKINRWASIMVILHAKSEDERSGAGGSMPFGGGYQALGRGAAAFGEDTFEVPNENRRDVWKRSEVGTPDGGCSHEFMVVKHRNGRLFITDLDFIGPQMRFVDPKGKTVRPYETPAPETAARGQFRERMRALGDI